MMVSFTILCSGRPRGGRGRRGRGPRPSNGSTVGAWSFRLEPGVGGQGLGMFEGMVAVGVMTPPFVYRCIIFSMPSSMELCPFRRLFILAADAAKLWVMFVSILPTLLLKAFCPS